MKEKGGDSSSVGAKTKCEGRVGREVGEETGSGNEGVIGAD